MSQIRRVSREILLQMLYARHELGSHFLREDFLQDQIHDPELDQPRVLDQSYIDTVESFVLEDESRLLSVITLLAPKFALDTMPALHILILMIALSEILHHDELQIPEAVTINEAIELTKKFSDTQGKNFINALLSSFLKQRDEILKDLPPSLFHIF